MTVRVWWVQSKPFDAEDLRHNPSDKENHKPSKVSVFQTECLEKRRFGMGWRKECEELIGSEDVGKEIIAGDLADRLRENLRNHAFTTAQNRFLEMREGDVVFTRLNDEYYCGVIAARPRMSDDPLLTWASTIRGEWKSLGSSEELPHHVRGKITGRDCHGTVAEIKGLSAWTLMAEAGIHCDKQTIDENDFFFALGDEDLEDLMAHYMSKKHEGYVFLPSSCKKGTPVVEYVMYDPKSGKMITCQTKVNDEIDIANYGGENYEKYERIYLFSGCGRYLHEELLPANVTILSRRDLYLTLKENALLLAALNKYFVFA